MTTDPENITAITWGILIAVLKASKTSLFGTFSQKIDIIENFSSKIDSALEAQKAMRLSKSPQGARLPAPLIGGCASPT